MIRIVAILLCLAAPLAAQERRASHCIALAEATPGITYLHQASYRDPIPEYAARITYLDHSMFLIQSEGGVNIVTDYNGFIGTADFLPDVVTMNHAHSTHWTRYPDPAIPHVLRGWGEPHGTRADHYVEIGDVLVRNVPTDIRSGFGDREPNGNSIFVFEMAGLCIGHLGHLHHEPNSAQYAALGRVDVVMAAVDGGTTVDLPTMIRILKRLKSSVVIPMHWFGRGTLDVFLAGMADEFDVAFEEGNSLMVSLRDLPDRPTVRVLSPAMLRDPE
ncbi:MBL fold metallo-hydrolase [Poseidonocella sedimentorum]|uniref:L-ascorbate metabolism protein UlaG, beta-lactamase superfamily n=1 Tax=Poseidonocella sedimentorum TaxID=871652 RepID=A0A1I6CPM9_9RHOB|nr:MBL fold metallo-hydrolase [Poseidonocella sedimentorum]SFQ95150.1 L-ascorbate metabolism protein UlaG, beta-lactamase superfamily [Poseidonocella sedimentorum]